jgi:peptidoglycan/LPS O-acetylase OafA/YrhL
MSRSIYFPGLNALRFYAALSVLVSHVGQYVALTGQTMPLQERIKLLFLRDSHAVTLFFVLSGFLITYLLFVEQQRSGTIAVKKFYARRILRIWPLYYLLTFIGFFGLPLLLGAASPITLADANHRLHFAFFLLFLPHATFFSLLPVAHLWSIGVEEQFYLIWPLLMRRFARHSLKLFAAIIMIKLILSEFARLMIPFDPIYDNIFRLLLTIRFECMAIGALGAYLVFHQREPILKIIYHPITQIVTLGLLALNIVFSEITYPNYDFLPLSVIYIVFTMNVACNPNSFIKLEFPLLNQLGKISYGIYMYHPVIIYLMLGFFPLLGLSDATTLSYTLVANGLAIGLTLGIAALSYRLFEKPFLRLKDRFTVVRSQVAPDDAPQPTPAEAALKAGQTP